MRHRPTYTLMQIVGEKEESPQSPKPSSHEPFSGMDHSVFVERPSLPAKQVEVERTSLNLTLYRKRQAACTKASSSLQVTPSSLQMDSEFQLEVKEQQWTEEKSVNDITLVTDPPKEVITPRFTRWRLLFCRFYEVKTSFGQKSRSNNGQRRNQRLSLLLKLILQRKMLIDCYRTCTACGDYR